jgi:CRP/FNR family transcriptional regulator
MNTFIPQRTADGNQPTGKNIASSGPLTGVQENTTILHNGDTLYRMGDVLKGIYLVNAGTVKSSRITESGDQQIIGFHVPGDLIGLEALGEGASPSMAVALDTTSVTLIPLDSLLTGEHRFDSQELIRRMGMSLNRDNDLIMMLSQRTADRRLAWFLVEYSDRLAGRGLSPCEFSLPMSRGDIALFLGLAMETVCRELAHFSELGLIEKDRRRVRLLNRDGLRRLAFGSRDN